MIKINVLKLDFGTMVLRYYLMMALVIAGGFTGMWWIALLALPIFLSAILGISVEEKEEATKKTIVRKLGVDLDKDVRKVS